MAYSSVKEFGESIIKKYPVYLGQDPEAIGQKMLKVYPQYKNNIEGMGGPEAQGEPPLEQGPKFSELPGNIPASGKKAIGDIASAIVHPLKTIETVVKTGVGGIQKLIPGQQPDEEINSQYADAFAGYFSDNYGSLQAAKKKLITDPVGTMLDLAGLLSGGGAIATKIGLLSKSGKIAKSGEILSKAGQAIDPTQIISTPLIKGVERAADYFQTPSPSYKPEVGELFEKQGIEAPLGALTENRGIQAVEALASKWFTGTKVGERIGTTIKSIHEGFNKIADDLNTGTLSMEVVGEMAQQNFSKFVDAFKETKNQMYDGFLEKVGNVKAPATITLQALDEIIALGKKSAAPTTSLKYFKDLKKNLLRKTKTKTKTKKKKKKMKMDFEGLKQTRTDFAQKMKFGDEALKDATEASKTQIYDALTQDLDTAAVTADPSLKGVFEEINNMYAQGKEKINSAVGNALANGNTQKLVTDFFKPKNKENLLLLKEMTGEVYGDMSTAFLGEVIRKSYKDLKGGKKLFDGAKFRKQLEAFDKDTLETIFSPEQLKILDEATSQITDFEKMMEAAKGITKWTGGSPTGFFNNILSIKTALGGIVLGAASGVIGVVTAVLGAVITIGGPEAAVRFMNSKPGRDFFTTGLKIDQATIESIVAAIEKITIPAAGLRIIDETASTSDKATKLAPEELEEEGGE